MKPLKCLGIAVLLTEIVASSTQAESKRLISQGSRMGTSWKIYLLNKKLVKEVSLGGETRKLYLAEMEINNSYSGTSRRTSLFQCSTSAPFVAFKDDAMRGLAILHYLNPGGNGGGYNFGSYQQYWAICHDLWQLSNEKWTSEAKRLSYSTELKSEQVEIPYELMQSLK